MQFSYIFLHFLGLALAFFSIKTEQSVPTNDFINVNVDAVAKVRISLTSEGIKLASKNFLNKQPADITRDLQDSLQGNMREIIGRPGLLRPCSPFSVPK